MMGLFKKESNKKGSCQTCSFNPEGDCKVGTVYAERGINGVTLCFGGELWEPKETK